MFCHVLPPLLVIVPPMKTFETENGDNSNEEGWKLHYLASKHGGFQDKFGKKESRYDREAVNVNLLRLIREV